MQYLFHIRNIISGHFKLLVHLPSLIVPPESSLTPLASCTNYTLHPAFLIPCIPCILYPIPLLLCTSHIMHSLQTTHLIPCTTHTFYPIPALICILKYHQLPLTHFKFSIPFNHCTVD